MKEKEIETSPLLVWNAIDRIQLSLSLSDNVIADYMGLKLKDFEKVRVLRKDPSIRSIVSLSNIIQVGFDRIVEAKIDYNAMIRQFQGMGQNLPEKYLRAAMTKRRVISTLLDYVEETMGFRARSTLMKDLQVTEDAFIDFDGTVSTALAVDIIDWVYQTNKNPLTVERMGASIMMSAKNQAVLSEIKPCRNVKEMFELLFSGVMAEKFEKNFAWKITKLKNGICRIRGEASELLESSLDRSYIQSHSTALIRKGMLSAMPCYLGQKHAKVQIASLFEGGKNTCEFEIELPSTSTKLELDKVSTL